MKRADVDLSLPLPASLVADLRTDHAGETGAVMIYRGILAATRDAGVGAFARGHLATEAAHLAAIELLLAPRHRSRLLPLWRAAGWLTGALPAWAGPQAVYATIEAVETFVDHHYTEQIDAIDRIDRAVHGRRCRPCARTCSRSAPTRSITATTRPVASTARRAHGRWRCACGCGPWAPARAWP